VNRLTRTSGLMPVYSLSKTSLATLRSYCAPKVVSEPLPLLLGPRYCAMSSGPPRAFRISIAPEIVAASLALV